MHVIYEPKGRAKEYSDLAVNDYLGCTNGCVYCFAPSIMHKDRSIYHNEVTPRSEAIYKWFEKDCIEMESNGDKRRVHMNFVSDPYPDIESEIHLTRYCIETAYKHGVGINILTKGKYEVIRPDLELFKKADVHFGVTCAFYDDEKRKQWEPYASSVSERLNLLKEAHEMGIFTWVSMEPVIYPKEALDFFKLASSLFDMKSVVDLWKVGKLNYHKHASTIDWVKFRDDFKSIAGDGTKYILKKSLIEA